MATAPATVQSGNFSSPAAKGLPLANSSGGVQSMAMSEQGGANFASMPQAQEAGPFGAVKQILNQPAVKKTLPLMVIALTLLAFALFYTLMNAPAYKSVVSGVTEADQQAAFDALKSGEFKPVIDASNGQITVPASRYHEAR